MPFTIGEAIQATPPGVTVRPFRCVPVAGGDIDLYPSVQDMSWRRVLWLHAEYKKTSALSTGYLAIYSAQPKTARDRVFKRGFLAAEVTTDRAALLTSGVIETYDKGNDYYAASRTAADGLILPPGFRLGVQLSNMDSADVRGLILETEDPEWIARLLSA